MHDWKLAEERWRNRGITEADYATWKSGRYISKNIATMGAPSTIRCSRDEAPTVSNDFTKLIEIATNIQSPKKRARFLQLIVSALPGEFGWSAALKSICLETMMIPNCGENLVWALVRDNTAIWRDQRFVEIADEVARRSSPRLWPIRDVSEIVSAFNRNPERRGLLCFIIASLTRLKYSKQWTQGLNASAFEIKNSDPVLVKQSAARLKILHGDWQASDIPVLIEFTRADADFLRLASVAMRSKARSPWKDFLAGLVQSSINQRSSRNDFSIEALSAAFDAQLSPLSDPANRKTLKLPEFPFPVGNEPN